VSTPRRSFHTVARIFIILVAIGFAVMSVWPKSRLLAVWLAHRNEGCSLAATLNSHEELLRFTKFTGELAALSHIIQREPSGYELLDTPRGQYWTSRHEPLIGFLLAEQETEIYGDVLHGVRPGDIVLDCGADIGVFTRTALFRGANRLPAASMPCAARSSAKSPRAASSSIRKASGTKSTSWNLRFPPAER